MKELWKDIPGYEGLYQVSDIGRVKSLNYARQHRENIKSLQVKPNGYVKVDLRHNGRLSSRNVHRLVAEVFIPNPNNKSDVNHIDGDKLNNCTDNLEWVTRSENMEHCKKVLNKNAGRAPIPVFCVETGVVYPNMHLAAKAVHGRVSGIKAAVDGVYHTSAGFHWKKLRETVSEQPR